MGDRTHRTSWYGIRSELAVLLAIVAVSFMLGWAVKGALGA